MFYFHPYLGKPSNLTNIFQMGWKHQLVIHYHFVDLDPLCFFKKITKTISSTLTYPSFLLNKSPESATMRRKKCETNTQRKIPWTALASQKTVTFGVVMSCLVLFGEQWPKNLLLCCISWMDSYPVKWELFHKPLSGWWFQIFFSFSPFWGRFPFWLIFVKWVETTN